MRIIFEKKIQSAPKFYKLLLITQFSDGLNVYLYVTIYVT